MSTQTMFVLAAYGYSYSSFQIIAIFQRMGEIYEYMETITDDNPHGENEENCNELITNGQMANQCSVLEWKYTKKNHSKFRKMVAQKVNDYETFDIVAFEMPFGQNICDYADKRFNVKSQMGSFIIDNADEIDELIRVTE